MSRDIIRRAVRLLPLSLLALAGVAGFALTGDGVHHANAQSATLTVYDDSLATGWTDWSDADADVNLANTSPVYSGVRSASFVANGNASTFYLHSRTSVGTAPYRYLRFAARASGSGQQYGVLLCDQDDNELTAPVPLAQYGGDPVTGSWRVYTIPLSALNASSGQINGVLVRDLAGQPEPAVFLDAIVFSSGAAPQPSPTTSPTAPPTVTKTPTVTHTSTPTATAPAKQSPTPAPTASPTPPPTPSPTSSGSVWMPPQNTSWQWQLTTPVDQSVNVAMYDIDLFDNAASVVASLHAQGRKVICYVDAGTYEDWRPDAASFPSSVLGASNGWPR